MDMNDPRFAALLKNAKAALNKDAQSPTYVKTAGVKTAGGGFSSTEVSRVTHPSNMDESRDLGIDAYEILKTRNLQARMNQINENVIQAQNSDYVLVSKKELNEVFESMLREFLPKFSLKIQEATIKKTLSTLLNEQKSKS